MGSLENACEGTHPSLIWIWLFSKIQQQIPPAPVGIYTDRGQWEGDAPCCTVVHFHRMVQCDPKVGRLENKQISMNVYPKVLVSLRGYQRC